MKIFYYKCDYYDKDANKFHAPYRTCGFVVGENYEDAINNIEDYYGRTVHNLSIGESNCGTIIPIDSEDILEEIRVKEMPFYG